MWKSKVLPSKSRAEELVTSSNQGYTRLQTFQNEKEESNSTLSEIQHGKYTVQNIPTENHLTKKLNKQWILTWILNEFHFQTEWNSNLIFWPDVVGLALNFTSSGGLIRRATAELTVTNFNWNVERLNDLRN